MSDSAGMEAARKSESLSPRASDLLVAVTALLCAVGAGIAASNDNLPAPGAVAAITVIAIGVPVAGGLYLLRRGIALRLAWMLVGVGLAWFLTTPALSDHEVPYALGRIAGWIEQALIVIVLLSFPAGRLQSRASRTIAGAAVAMVAFLYLPSVLFVDSFPAPAPWSPCSSDCPGNPFMITESEAGFVPPLESARDALVGLVFLATALALATRVRNATALTRTAWTPAVYFAIASLLLLVFVVAVRRSDFDPETAEGLALAGAFTVPLLAVGFSIGLLRLDLRAGHALATVNDRLDEAGSAGELERLLAGALGDPGLRLYLPASSGRGRWRDTAGNIVKAVRAGTGRVAVAVPAGSSAPSATLVCDRALEMPGGLIPALGGCIQAWLERARLNDALQSSLMRVDESRARLAAAADNERRRIERDLHDGAQQRLVALRIRLELAESLLDTDPEAAREAMHALGPSIDDVIDEVRALGHGIYPALLTDSGPAAALQAAGRESPLAVRMDHDGFGRHPADVESAIYFCCLEALQNAVKHAQASEVRITLRKLPGVVRFEVRDDGRGFPAGGSGTGGRGLTNMRDRISAVGGVVEVESFPGEGVAVRGTVPIPQRAASARAPAAGAS